MADEGAEEVVRPAQAADVVVGAGIDEAVDACRVRGQRLPDGAVGILVGDDLGAEGGPQQFRHVGHLFLQLLLRHAQGDGPAVRVVRADLDVADEAVEHQAALQRHLHPPPERRRLGLAVHLRQ